MRGHLSADELIEAAERVHNAPAGHLADCDRCQQAVRDLRDAITAAAAVDVPEPSPLFWEHLSARVHEAIVREGAPHRRFGWPAVPRVRLAMVAAGFAVVVAFVAGARLVGPHTTVPGSRTSKLIAPSSDPAAPDVGLSGDPSLTMMADLLADTDGEADASSGGTSVLVLRSDSLDRAVTMLSDDERAELQRLLKHELEKPGA